MFTGIIEEIGTVKEFTKHASGASLSVQANLVQNDLKIGDSIAINGCCQTVVSFGEKEFQVDVSPQTLKVTNLQLPNGAKVNLERALRLSDRLDGHIVSGHVDGVAKFVKKHAQADFCQLYFEIPENLTKYVVQKGSVSLNGISLTVAEIRGNFITVAVIPHTFKNTNLSYLKVAEMVNIEVDVLAKYVEKLTETCEKPKINMEFLAKNGF